jgi:hypothetical protein
MNLLQFMCLEFFDIVQLLDEKFTPTWDIVVMDKKRSGPSYGRYFQNLLKNYKYVFKI